MANLSYVAPLVKEITVTLEIKMRDGSGMNREMTFNDEYNGRETVQQLADLLLSACDLADSAGRKKNE